MFHTDKSHTVLRYYKFLKNYHQIQTTLDSYQTSENTKKINKTKIQNLQLRICKGKKKTKCSNNKKEKLSYRDGSGKGGEAQRLHERRSKWGASSDPFDTKRKSSFCRTSVQTFLIVNSKLLKSLYKQIEYQLISLQEIDKSINQSPTA